MATYKDDLDILKAAEKDANKLSLNAITELDNKGLLGMYGGGSEIKTGTVEIVNSSSAIAEFVCAKFRDGVFFASTNSYISRYSGLQNNIVFPSVIFLTSHNSIFQESSSREIIVTEEITLHVVNDGGGLV